MTLSRTYLMSPPEYFRVSYAINPWMDPAAPVDPELALKQWQQLRESLVELGHTVHELPPEPDLPDQVYAANGGFVLDGIAYGARFRYPQRAAEAAAHRRWYEQHASRLTWGSGAARPAGSGAGQRGGSEADGPGIRYVAPDAVNEGEGDLAWTGELILAGYGFRTDPAAHREVQEMFGHPVISLRLVDPRFYHLDTALAVLGQPGGGSRPGKALDEHTIAYFPGAFSEGSQRVLRRLFPEALIADQTDAAAFGLNLVSDGERVVLNAEATGMASKLAAAGYTPVPVELSELKKGGGSVKCCIQELRPSPEAAGTAKPAA